MRNSPPFPPGPGKRTVPQPRAEENKRWRWVEKNVDTENLEVEKFCSLFPQFLQILFTYHT